MIRLFSTLWPDQRAKFLLQAAHDLVDRVHRAAAGLGDLLAREEGLQVEDPRLFRCQTRLDFAQQMSRSIARLSRPRLSARHDLRPSPRLDAFTRLASRCAAATTRRCSPAPSRRSREASRSVPPGVRVSDPSRRLLEDLGDLHFVLDCGKPSSEPRQEIASALSRRSSSGFPSASSSPNFRRLSIRSPFANMAAWQTGRGDDASVGPPEEKRTALSGFGPDPRSIGLERAIARRMIQ